MFLACSAGRWDQHISRELQEEGRQSVFTAGSLTLFFTCLHFTANLEILIGIKLLVFGGCRTREAEIRLVDEV